MRSATCLQTLHILLSFALKAAMKALFLCVINSSTSRKPKYLLHSITMSLELVLHFFAVLPFVANKDVYKGKISPGTESSSTLRHRDTQPQRDVTERGRKIWESLIRKPLQQFHASSHLVRPRRRLFPVHR